MKYFLLSVGLIFLLTSPAEAQKTEKYMFGQKYICDGPICEVKSVQGGRFLSFGDGELHIPAWLKASEMVFKNSPNKYMFPLIVNNAQAENSVIMFFEGDCANQTIKLLSMNWTDRYFGAGKTTDTKYFTENERKVGKDSKMEFFLNYMCKCVKIQNY